MGTLASVTLNPVAVKARWPEHGLGGVPTTRSPAGSVYVSSMSEIATWFCGGLSTVVRSQTESPSAIDA
jgi:hypothetical protein